VTLPEQPDHAFLRQHRLAERFSALRAGEHFVVAETGFGDGHRFLATWQLWRESTANNRACLHFISVVDRPLSPEDVVAAGSATGLSPLAEELLVQFPPVIAGPQRLVLDQGRVRLTLYFGEPASALTDLDFRADAWFFHDPDHSRNQELLDKHSHQTLAGAMNQSGPGKIGIIGAGIAGALLAANLAGRGFQVTLIDRADSVASEASGNRQGALYVKLGVDDNDQTRLALSSLLFSQRFYRQFRHCGWHPTGLLQLAYSPAEADRQARFLARNQYPTDILEPVSADQASRLAGVPIPHSGLWFPGSGWLEPKTLCRRLSDSPGVAHRLGFDVRTLTKDGENWSLTSSQGETLSFDQIVLCAGAETPPLIPLDGHYRIKKIRGQITEVPADSLNPPALVVCGPGYLNPVHNGSALVGATFDLHDPSPVVTDESNRENLRMLSDFLPEALKSADVATIAGQTLGRVAFRCTTHDYQPIAGPMKNRDGSVVDGLWLFTGLGSKGLTYSPLLAEYLADLLSGQPPCLPRNLMRRVETQRCHRPEKTEN
jgi:tRNA 5-methylaminomethyl-2-thiouridine biosynthesis bifunctional protein